MSLLYLEAAKRHVAAFSSEEMVIEDHHQAMDCFDCEAFLQLGIDAYDWLSKADVVIRRSILKGDLDFSEDVEKIIENLFRAWLLQCSRASSWIKRVEEHGHLPENLDRFRKCESQVRSLVAFLDDDQMTAAVREARDQALAEHARGETAEFI